MISIKPLLTEKTMANAQKGVFTFRVSPEAGKYQIKQAIESLFSVNVTKIHTSRLSARLVRSRKTGKYLKTKALKKALIHLKDKQTIDLFEVQK